MDDLREFCPKESSIPIFPRRQDLPILNATFPYIFQEGKATGSGYVSKINCIPYDPEMSFNVLGTKRYFVISGLDIFPFNLDHGKDSTASGYIIGKLVYLSGLFYLE
jgi:hypothetical protein